MGKKISILFVDDEPGLLDQAKIFLERENEELDIITVSSANKALDLLQKENFGVIVSDYQMPEMDGLEFLEILRKEKETDIPFIMFTGKGREEVAMKALNLGAQRYIQKGGDPKNQFDFLANAIIRENTRYSTKKEREEKVKELYNTSVQMPTCYSEEEIYAQVLSSAQEVLGFEVSIIFMVEDENLVVKAVEAPNIEVGESHPKDEGIRGMTHQNQRSYLIDDLSDWEEAQLSDPDFESTLCIPVKDEGVFQAYSYEKDYFNEFDLEMTKILISHMSQVIDNLRYQEVLKENRFWLFQIVHNTPIAIFVIDEEHKVTHWNKACENLTGISRSEVLGKKDAWKAFYNEERPVMADLVLKDASEEKFKEYYGEKFTHSRFHPDAYDGEDYFPKLGDEGRWVFFTAAPINNSEGKRIGAIETLQDITAQKETEEELDSYKKG